MEKIEELAQLFKHYKIYPESDFHTNSPLQVFKKEFPDNYYAKDMNAFLKFHKYERVRKGADLPWWGKNYFNPGKTGKRGFIIGQDSKAEDAGSIAFFAHLFTVLNGSEREVEKKYKQHTSLYSTKFGFGSWRKLLQLWETWKLNLDYLYITDAKKVYQVNFGSKFDNNQSRTLLYNEISICKPNFIIVLGSDGWNLLRSKNDVEYKSTFAQNTAQKINGISCFVSPFPIGSGPTQKGFKDKMEQVSHNLNTLLPEIPSR